MIFILWQKSLLLTLGDLLPTSIVKEKAADIIYSERAGHLGQNFVLCLGFGVTLGNTQGLLLALYYGCFGQCVVLGIELQYPTRVLRIESVPPTCKACVQTIELSFWLLVYFCFRATPGGSQGLIWVVWAGFGFEN